MKLEAFRTIIREEVRSVIKEELSLIMQSPITETKKVYKPIIEQQTSKPTFSEILNEEKLTYSQPQPTKPLSTGNPILDILNETASSGEWRSLIGGYDSSHADGFSGGLPVTPTRVVDSVDQMLAGKQGATDINQVSIDAVPDFSKMMNKFKEIGKI